jgi:predicted CXXCH cytochrome family protein
MQAVTTMRPFALQCKRKKCSPHPALATFVLALVLPDTLPAQNTDSLVLENTRPFTVLDQISNPSEREAVLDVYRAGSSREKANKAETFLVQYPQSWLLAEIYEIAAKAFIDLGDFDRALQYGRASLEILPENPLLLVPLANVEATQGLTAEAEQNAQDALDYLEQFGRPSSIPEKTWPEVRNELKASCFFVLGRVRTLQALSLPSGEERSKKLVAAIKLLGQARSLNADDSEIEYLTGLDYMASGNQHEAAKWIAAAYRREGPLKPKALAKLERIFEQSQHPTGQSFSRFLEGLGQPDPPPAMATSATIQRGALPSYAGSSACGSCHADIYRNWSQTGMSQMLRPYKPENIRGDFTTDNVFFIGDEVLRDKNGYEFVPGKNREPFARMILEQGRHYFELMQSDQRWHRYPVDYTIGSKWQQGYVTRLRNGQLQVFPIEFNVRYHKWVNFWKIIDAPGTDRDDPHNWERYSPAANYIANCAACHTSQLRNLKGGGFEPENLEFREPGIGCEMCHGPGGRHVSSLLEGKAYQKDPLDPPVDFAKISSYDSVAICAQCHLQSAIRAPGLKGELNYSRESDVFFKRYKSRPYAEFFLTARYKDGRFRQTSFIVESFLRSRCFRRGGATCVSCHDPHADDAASNPTSLRFRGQPNKLCVQCHHQFEDSKTLQQHTRHPLNTEGSECVSCHMPRIMDALMSMARTHSIDDRPNARMTERFGQEDSPNACLICHTDKNIAWLDQQLERGWKVGIVPSRAATGARQSASQGLRR